MAVLSPKSDIGISLSTKFQLKLTILIFWTILPKKGIFSLKQIKKVLYNNKVDSIETGRTVFAHLLP